MYSFRHTHDAQHPKPPPAACRQQAQQHALLTRSEFSPQHQGQRQRQQQQQQQQQTSATVDCHEENQSQENQRAAHTGVALICEHYSQGQQEPQQPAQPRQPQVHHISPTTSGCLPQVNLNLLTGHHNNHLLHTQATSALDQAPGSAHMDGPANTSGSSTQRQYFMRSSLNESIKARRSHRRSQRRTSGRRLGLAPVGGLRRQVRFQPIPQAINISAYSSTSDSGGSCCSNGLAGDDDDDDDHHHHHHHHHHGDLHNSQLSSSSLSGLETSTEQRVSGPAATYAMDPKPGSSFIKGRRSRHLNIKRVQQQLSRLGRRSRIKMSAASGTRPKLSTKPFAQQLGNNIKSFASFGGKIKSFASHLHQSLGGTATSSQQISQIPPAPPTPKLPLQKTFHLRTSAASARHQITLQTVGGSQLQQQQQSVIASLMRAPATSSSGSYHNLQHQQQHPRQAQPAQPPAADLDDGWGSDFDETPSHAADTTEASQASGRTANNDTTTCSGASNGCYLLEIGKSSCDARAVCDIIQDQGTCGQFKRLHDVSLLDIPYQPPVKQQQHQQQLEDQQRIERVRESLHRVELRDERDAEGGEHSDDVASRVLEQSAGQTPSELTEGQDEDEEAELRSLEARQGYKQVRDKLKLILDQRLACFERDLSCEGAAAAAAAAAAAVPAVRSPAEGQQQQEAEISGGASVASRAGREQGRRREEAPRDEPARQEHLVGVEVQVDRFDCQSNCSEASSLSSGGLDSNHSGSQDSGHSTQHSGYSALRHHHHNHNHEHHVPREGCAPGRPTTTTDAADLKGANAAQVATSAETSPTNQLDSGASTCGDEPSPSPQSSQAPSDAQPTQMFALTSTPKSQVPSNQAGHLLRQVAATAGPQTAASQTERAKRADSSPEFEERRNRFIQNRLIINSKLESMFRSRSGGGGGGDLGGRLNTAASRNSLASDNSKASTPDHNGGQRRVSQVLDNSPTKSVQSCPTPVSGADHRQSHLHLAGCQSEPSIKLAGGLNAPLDPATRLRLLEQQRQMSLKLKQKPRRRTAKRALNLDCGVSLASCSGSSTGCNASLDNQSISTITNEEEPCRGELDSPAAAPAARSSRFSRNGSTRRNWNRDSLTKQLSMVCLRQLERSDERAEQVANVYAPSKRPPGAQPGAHQGAPKPALSLRQLVKETIDDCEKPSKLSTLTRNILNRSDSLSSQDGSGEQLC